MKPPDRSSPGMARDDTARRRAQELRPAEIEIPDVRSRAFLVEARRQSRLVASADDEDEIQDFIEHVTDGQSRRTR